MHPMEVGDKVRHKTNHFYNMLEMTIIEVENDKIYSDFFDNIEKVYKTSPAFNNSVLALIQKAEGGFI